MAPTLWPVMFAALLPDVRAVESSEGLQWTRPHPDDVAAASKLMRREEANQTKKATAHLPSEDSSSSDLPTELLMQRQVQEEAKPLESMTKEELIARVQALEAQNPDLAAKSRVEFKDFNGLSITLFMEEGGLMLYVDSVKELEKVSAVQFIGAGPSKKKLKINGLKVGMPDTTSTKTIEMKRDDVTAAFENQIRGIIENADLVSKYEKEMSEQFNKDVHIIATTASTDEFFLRGGDACKCISIDPNGQKIYGQKVQEGKKIAGMCGAWAATLDPRCGPSGDKPQYCEEAEWCFVDPCNCHASDLKKFNFAPDVKYSGMDLYYSADTCSGEDMEPRGCATFTTRRDCRSAVDGENKPLCEWTGATCYSKDRYEVCKGQYNEGDENCPCLELPVDVLQVEAKDLGVPASRLKSFGATCDAWDNGRFAKHCETDWKPGQEGSGPGKHKGWCTARWCYVDPCNCNLPNAATASVVSKYPSGAVYQGRHLYISYATCSAEQEMGTKIVRCDEKTTWSACMSLGKCSWTTMPEEGEAPCYETIKKRNAECQRTAGYPQSECTAPQDIEFAKAKSCAEGDKIPDRDWCTPQCATGKMSFVNVKNVAVPWPCYDHQAESAPGLFGSKLCCFAGRLTPPYFHCVPDLFTLMDGNVDGVISKEEYKQFYLKGKGESDEEVRQIVAQSEEMEELADADSISKKQQTADSEEEDPVVFFFIVAVSVASLVAACGAVWFVVHHSRKPPPDEDEDINGPIVLPDVKPVLIPPGLEPPTYLQLAGTAYDGVFELQSGVLVNEMPMWVQFREGQESIYLFSATMGIWYIGGEAEKVADFADETGYARGAVQHSGVFPNNIEDGQWMSCIEGNWIEDPLVKITVADPPAETSALPNADVPTSAPPAANT